MNAVDATEHYETSARGKIHFKLYNSYSSARNDISSCIMTLKILRPPS